MTSFRRSLGPYTPGKLFIKIMKYYTGRALFVISFLSSQLHDTKHRLDTFREQTYLGMAQILSDFATNFLYFPGVADGKVQ